MDKIRDKRLKIVIDKPVSTVFEFTTNPTNTPKWIDGIVFEETNETPAKLGTVFRNKNKNGIWNECVMTAFAKNKMFELTRINGNYHIRYTFAEVDDSSCQFEYYEWVDTGELDDTFSQEVLQKLKNIIEKTC